jgi:hypothetical protein
LPATSIKPSTVPKQWENWDWIVALLCCFFLGWILGGNYYLRRDHTRRHKLHL